METMGAIDAIFTFAAQRHYKDVRHHLTFEVVAGDGQKQFDGWTLCFFDVGSSKTP